MRSWHGSRSDVLAEVYPRAIVDREGRRHVDSPDLRIKERMYSGTLAPQPRRAVLRNIQTQRPLRHCAGCDSRIRRWIKLIQQIRWRGARRSIAMVVAFEYCA